MSKRMMPSIDTNRISREIRVTRKVRMTTRLIITMKTIITIGMRKVTETSTTRISDMREE